MPDHDAELDAIVTMLEAAGMIEQYTDDDGKSASRLTERGAQMGRALAMAGDDAEAVLTAACNLFRPVLGPCLFPRA